MPIPLEAGLVIAMVVTAAALARRMLPVRRRERSRAGTGNPLAPVDHAYLLQQAALHEVRRGVAGVVTTQRRLELQAARLAASRDTLRSEARLALVAGQEDQARATLTRAEVTHQQLEQLNRDRQALDTQAQQLRATAEGLEARVQAMRTHRDRLRAQEWAARAQGHLCESLTGLAKGSETPLPIRGRARSRTLPEAAAAPEHGTDALGARAGGGRRTPRARSPVSSTASLLASPAPVRSARVGPGDALPPITGPVGSAPSPHPPSEDT